MLMMSKFDSKFYSLYGATVFIFLALAIISNYLINQRIIAHNQDLAQQTANMISKTIVREYMSQDWLSVSQKIRSVLANEAIVYVAVLDNNNQTVSAYRSDLYRNYSFTIDNEALQIHSVSMMPAPITFDQSVLGQVQVAVSSQTWNILKIQLSILIVLALLFFIVGIYFFTTYYLSSVQNVVKELPIAEGESEGVDKENAIHELIEAPVKIQEQQASLLLLYLEPKQQQEYLLNPLIEMIEGAVNLYGGKIGPRQGARVAIWFGLSDSDTDHAFQALCAAHLIAGLLKYYSQEQPSGFLYMLGLDTGQLYADEQHSCTFSFSLEQRIQELVEQDLASMLLNPVRATIRFANHQSLVGKAFTDHNQQSLAIWLENHYSDLINNQVEQLAERFAE